MRFTKTYFFILVIVVTILNSCTTSRNTFINRGYHNLTARYNGYYYATESVKDGVDKIKEDYVYDYDKLLPVFLIPTNESAKSTFPEFDKAIKKSSNCIQKHTIKDKKTKREVTTAGHWIDNNWNVIGVSHFYKREFFSGIEAFEYVIRSYKSKDRYKAMIWLAKSYNEIGSPTQAEPIIGLLKDDKKISKYARLELPAVRADYFMRRGMYKEAEKMLLAALNGGDGKGTKSRYNLVSKIKNPLSKKTRARYSFILAQLYEERKENKKAIQFYKKTISLKPEYDLVFNAKMKQARLFDVNTGNVAKLKKELKQMTRDVKNKEYLDIIYYTLGEIAEKEKDTDLAFTNYKLSVKNSTQNPKQKALSYLKLGELSFDATDYTSSGAYYDSTLITLPKDYKDYDVISKRKTTLETLVGYIKTIQKEDSLQKIAGMSEVNRDKFIAKLIKKIEEDEERKKEELENAQTQNQNPNYNPNSPNNGLAPIVNNNGQAAWYFYNQTTLSFGLNDFIKKWGNRKLEDNWRRSQKAVAFESQSQVPNSNDTSKTIGTNATKNNSTNTSNASLKSKEFYLVDLPLNDSLIEKSNAKIIDSYYNLGSTYKDELNNNKKSIESYETLNKRFATNKYKVATYYQLYKIYTSTRNQAQADNYKNKLFTEFPTSEYTQILKNPNYVAEKNSQKGEVELFYTKTFDFYTASNYSQAFSNCNLSVTQFGKNDFSGKFAYIKAMCLGKLKGADTLETALKQYLILYPKEPAINQAKDVLLYLKTLKNPSEATSNAVNNTDTFTLDLSAEHFVVIVYPDDPSIANAFKNALATFNETLYSNDNYSITNTLFGTAQQLSNVKTFKNAETAKSFIENLQNDKEVFKGSVKRELFSILAVSTENLPRIYRKKQINSYTLFYNDNYKIK